MKLTKKAAALLLAAALAVSVCATPVFAADPATTPPDMGSQLRDNTKDLGSGVVTGSTRVIYKVTESYAWSIPATIDFGEDAGVNNTSTVNATLKENGPGKKAEKDSAGTTWKGTAPKVVVSKNVIGVGKRLQITFNTDYLDKDTGKFYVLATGTTKTEGALAETQKLYFKIEKNDANKTELTQKNNEVLSVDSGTNTAYQELVFTLSTTSDTAEKAGDYEGHVVFQSKIV